VNEEDLLKLLAYVKSLAAPKTPPVEPKSPAAIQSNAGAPTNPGAMTTTTTTTTTSKGQTR